MPSEGTQRQRFLLTIVGACVVIVVGDIIAANIAGEVSGFWWTLMVPIGLLLVPIVGVVSFVRWLVERQGPHA